MVTLTLGRFVQLLEFEWIVVVLAGLVVEDVAKSQRPEGQLFIMEIIQTQINLK
jgi:hypothetical protein